jgi:hypothetical protein
MGLKDRVYHDLTPIEAAEAVSSDRRTGAATTNKRPPSAARSSSRPARQSVGSGGLTATEGSGRSAAEPQQEAAHVVLDTKYD